MKTIILSIVSVGVASVAMPARSHEDNVAWMMQTNALEEVASAASADVPSVLVLGDSISIGYTPFLRERMAGTANVGRPKTNCGATQFYLRDRGGMRDWVGTNRWDVIVVNCGIWDICYMKGSPTGTDHYWGPNKDEAKLPPLERGTAIRARGFHVRTSPCEYAENLKTIISFLKSTGATVLFALSTPCPAYENDDRCGLIRAYNEIASSVCGRLSVRTVDLYAVGERNYRHQPDRCHYDKVGNAALAERLCVEIKRALAERAHGNRAEVAAPRGFTSRVTWENMKMFAHCNAESVARPVRGIVVFHHGLGCTSFDPCLKSWEENYARNGIVAIHPHASPWGWMNDTSIKLADALVDRVIEKLKLPADVPVCSAGGSMGGQGALVFARYSRHHVVSVVANCAVCDLVYHETERPDLPRTIAAAFGDQPDYDAAIRAHSPLALVPSMPDIDYFLFHVADDSRVSKKAHTDRLAEALRAAGRRVTYVVSGGKSHCVLEPEVRARYELAILNSFPPVEKATCEAPDVLTAADGTRIATAGQWEKIRRPELLKTFLEREYGERPVERPADLAFTPIGDDRTMMDGRAVRKRVAISCTGPEGPFSFAATAFIPKAEKPAGAFILICNRKPGENIDPERNVKSGFWPAEEIVARGYAAVAFWNGDVAADDKNACMTTGVFRAWHKAGARTRTGWGALSAWAWGASRVLDWLETIPQIDARRVAVVGHSRGGKTALLAGVTDTRFALACVNDSGCSGAKLNHANLPKSESIRIITKAFPHWFCLDYANCADKEFEIGFDQHEMVALMAPRAVAIASATLDDWAGQRAEFCSAALASPVWRLYGLKGLAPAAFPAPGGACQKGSVSYHLRTGSHNLTPEDWNRYMDFADRVFAGKR